MQNQATLSAPNPNASTLVLNTHKPGSVNGMMSTNECVDPQIRSYHV